MVKIEDLKLIDMLKDLPIHLLEILSREAGLSIFGTGTRLITINEKTDTFYMLLMGQVAVKKEIAPDVDIIFDYLQSGSSFGSASLIKDSVATYTAVCQEPCEVITLYGRQMQDLFIENHELGYRMMLRIARQYKNKMEKRAQMIMKTLDEHPELASKTKDLEELTPVF